MDVQTERGLHFVSVACTYSNARGILFVSGKVQNSLKKQILMILGKLDCLLCWLSLKNRA
eukprot:m.99216 g.99216  ORF g.99216 m.99216 type:complete len:60 (+) comp37050_c0_seq8:412-591(+)